MRAKTGLTPDGMKQKFTVDATRFLTAGDQLRAISRAETIYRQTGRNVININMGDIIGEGYTKLNKSGYGLNYLQSTNVRTVFKNSHIYTQFPFWR